jgi:hypothetical protein
VLVGREGLEPLRESRRITRNNPRRSPKQFVFGGARGGSMSNFVRIFRGQFSKFAERINVDSSRKLGLSR